MMKWLLDQLDRHGRKKIIKDRDEIEDYLTRYYVAWPDRNVRKRKDIPFNTFLHQFMRSDDPVFHNHPWEWYFTVILKGGYHEHTPWGTTWRGPGSWKFQEGNYFRLLGGKAVYNSQFVRNLVPEWNKEPMGQPLLHSDLHWVEVPEPGKTWTLFTRGRTFGDWGFVPDINTGKWIQHEEYLNSVRKPKP